jgi:predicted nucleic acid-binding Zn ribbon protein
VPDRPFGPRRPAGGPPSPHEFFFGPRVTDSDREDPTSGDNPVDSVDNAVTLRPIGSAEPAASGDLTTRAGIDRTETRAGDTERQHPRPRGSDIARAALQAAREAAKASGAATPGTGSTRRRTPSGQSGSRRRRRWSGPRPDDRDPQTLGRLAARIAADRGWNERLAGGNVFGRWAAIVGDDVAEHATPVSLQDGVLTVQAASTAWATQLRLLQRQLLAKIAAGVGSGVVTKLKVRGPAAPSWRHGPRHVSGRGPRDTYG